jgi:hypothetical protein
MKRIKPGQPIPLKQLRRIKAVKICGCISDFQ